MLFQLPDGGQAVHGIAGKATDRLGDDEIDMSGQGISDHFIEAIPVRRIRSADALIRIYTVSTT